MSIESADQIKVPLEEKRQRWEEKMAEMLKPDVYGYVLDEGIRDTVVALQLLGFNTTQSDQGNRGDSPWVTFWAGEEPKAYYEGEEELKNQLMKEKGISPEEIDPRSPSFDRSKQVEIEDGARDKLASQGAHYTQEYEQSHAATLEMASKLQTVIDNFYSSQPTPDESADLKVSVTFPYRTSDHAQHIQDIPWLEVVSMMGEPQNTEMSEEEREKRVAHTKHEMERFTEFLKERYFSS